MSELEFLAAVVHSSVAAGNLLGAVFNLRRRQYWWCAVHLAGVIVHVNAAREHCRTA